MLQSMISLLTKNQRAQVKQNTEDVNQSVVQDLKNSTVKTFSSADLWNIQRKRKMMTQRRWSF